ncbi:MAG: OmpA family protein [Porphyromonadaceae bacterium]|nr:OmpA family protein [Porphyromonadaceae bacterium]
MTLALAALAASALQAQEPAQKPAYKTSFVKDGKAHWFLEVGDAATISLAGNNRDVNFTDRVSLLNPSLAIGRWSTPAFGMRLTLQGGKTFDYARPAGLWAAATTTNGYLRHDVTYGFAQYDFLFDLVNYFAPYKENRFFHIIPFLGVGLGYKHEVEAINVKDKSHRFSPLADAGLQLKLRLARFVDFNLEGKITASDLRLPSQEDHVKSGTDFIAQAGASLTFHLGRKAFEAITPNDEALIADLNGQINALRAENAELAKRPVRCPDVEIPVADSKVIGNVIYFRLNSAVVDKNQMINVYNIAEYAKSNTETITLVGYADRQTGNPNYNMALSKRRAEAVANILVKKYGISRDRLKIDWKGDTVQPYAENVWNRIVLMSAE